MMKKKKNYIENFCTGCGLCHSVKNTEFRIINDGFPSPNIIEGSDYEFYENTCPVFYYFKDRQHDIWGNINSAFIGYSSNEEIRYRASSGGALTEICSWLIETKYVDGILHVTYDKADQTKTVSCLSSTIDEVQARCGSRYSISVPLYNLHDYILPNKRYAFVGKPCDVMALRSYLNKNRNLKDNIILLLSFFCAGEPSVTAQKKLLQAAKCNISECASIRYRGYGWPGYTTITKTNGEEIKIPYKVTWGDYLGRSIRNICRFCLDGTGDAADIVCADFWHLDDNNTPDFSEHDGRNIIIARTELGDTILKNVIKSKRLFIESDFTDKISSEFKLYQPSQYKRKTTMKSMIFAMKIMGRSVPKYNKEMLNRYAEHASDKLKREFFFGTIKRVLKGKI